MKSSKIAIINYGAGNFKSVTNALKYLNQEFEIIEYSERINKYSHVILPGVGSFKKAMTQIKAKGLDSMIYDISKRGVPILGICLGMQLLGSRSSEDGETEGLKLVDADIDKFGTLQKFDGKIPHVGFDSVEPTSFSGIYAGFEASIDVYFTHSFRMLCKNAEDVASYSTYGIRYASSICKENIVGTQFHPEKSQKNGLKILNNFLNSF